MRLKCYVLVHCTVDVADCFCTLSDEPMLGQTQTEKKKILDSFAILEKEV